MPDKETIILETVIRPLANALQQRTQRLCTAESCTGGMIAMNCTEMAGASAWFDRGFVTYSNAAKNEAIGVPTHLIEHYGAVSSEVAQAMAIGALKHSHAHWSIAVTGIAGPGGGSLEKPIGLVWFGFASRSLLGTRALIDAHTVSQQFHGTRHMIRTHATQFAVQELVSLICKAE